MGARRCGIGVSPALALHSLTAQLEDAEHAPFALPVFRPSIAGGDSSANAPCARIAQADRVLPLPRVAATAAKSTDIATASAAASPLIQHLPSSPSTAQQDSLLMSRDFFCCGLLVGWLSHISPKQCCDLLIPLAAR